MGEDRMPLRAIRVPDELWQAAQAVAEQQGRGVSEMVRECLTKAVKTHERKTSR